HMTILSYPKYLLLVVMIAIIFIQCHQKKSRNENVTSGYNEQHRPQFHFSPPEKWMNDPNGMVYYNGVYHLFYQYYPDSTVWGPMHWGHAVSKDLVHWDHMPVALFPDSLGYIFSGSAIVDRNNTSGLGANEQPPLVAIYTYHDPEGEKAGKNDYQVQGLAYSNDEGKTWNKHPSNPVLRNPGIKDFRDPKVFWYEVGKKWMMTLAVYDHISLYSSPDLQTWTFESDFGKEHGSHAGVWECPDLFPIKVQGDTITKWVLLLSINPGGPNGGSATQYFVGSFDGKRFVADSNTQTKWLDRGRDNYAGVTWSDMPTSDGRHIFLGWMSNWLYGMKVPTEKWRSAMTIPRELKLYRIEDDFYVHSIPVKELELLRTKEIKIDSQTISGEIDLSSQIQFSPSQMEGMIEFNRWDTMADFGIELSNARGEKYRIGFNAATNEYYSDRTKSGKLDFSNEFGSKIVTASRQSQAPSLKWHIFFDKTSVEFFADKGNVVFTEIFFPNEDFTTVKLYSSNGSATLNQAEFYCLKSIWR
ncbi:MAG: glycoside hydrolase family 32 protein, partial [Saprospiraceae bacterium]